ncbi:MAG: hypothetical protein ACJARS_001588 [bacterium]|jgi:hypothetical protein
MEDAPSPYVDRDRFFSPEHTQFLSGLVAGTRQNILASPVFVLAATGQMREGGTVEK